ncbi:MAG: dihydropteroate synthase [candidate division Zixibacteria bacterium]|nr:dihydropteroate synthase [candidate division Zixibacteria bacterium]
MARDLTPLRIGDSEFDFSRAYLMGILNVTPDSFSDGGHFDSLDKARRHAVQMVNEGADLIDIGGESTRPGSESVSAEVELERVIPVIEALRSEIDIPLSIDTCKAEVARSAVSAGASLINDVTGLQGDPEMVEVALKHDVPVVVMHIKGKPRTMQKNPVYDDLIGEIKAYFTNSIDLAERAGLKRERLILDPGIGFGKTYDHNFRIINNLWEFKDFGLPLLAGASRKRFLSDNDRYPVDQRVEQSLTVAAMAVAGGANFVRVHDVAPTKKALWTVEKIIRV